MKAVYLLMLLLVFGCSPDSEEILKISDLDEISFRWSRAFEDAYLFKLERTGKKVIFHTTTFDDDGLTQKFKEESFKDIDPEIFYALEKQLTSLEIISNSMKKDSIGADGSTWTLVGVKGDFSFSVSAWAPLRQRNDGYVNPVGALGKRIIELSGLEFDEDKIY